MVEPQKDMIVKIFSDEEMNCLNKIIEDSIPNIKYQESLIPQSCNHYKEHMQESNPFKDAKAHLGFYTRKIYFNIKTYYLYTTTHKRYSCNDGDCTTLLLHIVFN